MLTLGASDTYFEGRPNLDEAVYRIIPDPATMFLELRAQNIGMMGLTPLQYTRQTENNLFQKEMKYKDEKYVRSFVLSLSTKLYYCFNFLMGVKITV